MKWEDRLKAQMPQNALASAGMMCVYCDLGPCSVNPFDEEPRVGACGITAEGMNYVNMGMDIVKGLADYKITDQLSLSLDRMVGPSHTVGVTTGDLLEASKRILDVSQELVGKWSSPQRKPREIEHGIGVLQRDYVNIVLTDYDPEMIKQSRSQQVRDSAREKGAQGVNLVGALCGGAEASYNYGIPLLGCSEELDESSEMIDMVYQGGDPKEACEKAVEHFSKRDKAAFRHYTPKRYMIGYDITKDTINEAVDRKVIKGVVAVVGCEGGKCTWDVGTLIEEVAAKDYLVLNMGCRLREAELGVKGCALTDEYNIPCVVNGGACEPGKILGIKNVTVLMPRWRDPKLLTAAFAFASEGIPVILGVLPFIVPTVRTQLANAGINVETDSTKVPELLG